MIELVSYGLYRYKFGDYDRKQLQLERVNTIAMISGEGDQTEQDGVADIGELRKEILHPYTGYTVDGKRRKPGCDVSGTTTPYECYERILKPDDLPLPRRNEGVLNVALLGGSVAVGVAHGALRNVFQKKLAALPGYANRKVNLHVLAAGGFRQPQQLMMLNYYYTLGVEYDLIISLDAFNEIAIGANEYKWTKTHPSFPRSWSSRVATRVDPQLVTLQAQRALNDEAHLRRARFMSNAWSRNSPLNNVLWRILHSRYQSAESALLVEMDTVSNDADVPAEFRHEALGPDYRFENWDQLLADSAKIWARANYLVQGVADLHGAKFFHFIQPNQYIEGAKPLMGKSERSIAFVDPKVGGYGTWYRMGYTHLLEQQKWLAQQGVITTDLTFLYKDTAATIYIDNCCHVNQQGSTMIIDAIVDTIGQHAKESNTNLQ